MPHSRVILAVLLGCTLLIGSRNAGATAKAVVPLVAYTQNNNVYLAAIDGRDRVTVTTRGRGDGRGFTYPWYQWSPDGKYLLLVRLDPRNGNSDLLLLDKTGSVVKTLAKGLSNLAFYPSWAIDADEIAYVTGIKQTGATMYLQVAAIDNTGNAHERWQAPTAGGCGVGEGNGDPAVAFLLKEAASTRIVTWSVRQHLAIYADPCNGNLSIIDLRTGKAPPQTLATLHFHDPALSTRGRLAAVLDTFTGNGADATVVILDARTGAMRKTMGPGETPAWSADGSLLYYQERALLRATPSKPGLQTYSTTLWRVAAGGTKPTRLAVQKAFYFGRIAPLGGTKGVLFSRIDNDTVKTKSLTDGDPGAVRPQSNQPHSNLVQVDGSGRVTVVVRDAGQPALQPK